MVFTKRHLISIYAIALVVLLSFVFVWVIQVIRNRQSHIPSGDHIAQNVLTGHNDFVSQLIFSGNSKRLISASWDGSVKVWDVKTGNELCTLISNQYRLTALAFNDHSQLVAAGDHDGKVVVWDIKQIKTIAALTRPPTISSLSFSVDGNDLLIANDNRDRSIISWDYIKNTHFFTNKIGISISCASLPKIGSVCVTSTEDGLVTIWDKSLAERLWTLPIHYRGPVYLSFSRRRALLASYWPSSNTGIIWDLASKRKVSAFTSKTTRRVSSLCLSPNGNWLIVGGSVSVHEPGMIQLFDANTGVCRRILRAHQSIVYSVEVSPDESLLATGGGRDHSIKLWSMQGLINDD
jgi:WD40 repeat protein